MGLFGKRRSIAPVLEDPVFGRIAFDHGVWSYVPSSLDELGITIDAPQTGPTAIQRESFRNVRENLANLAVQAIRFIALADKTIDPSLLTAYSIEIGTEEQSQRQCFAIELSDDSAELIYRVSFESNLPVAYQCDD